MRGEFVEVAGARLYYYAAGTRGAGEPVVLLHGCPTASHLWGQVVPLLPSGHRAIVVDLLGFGRSDPPLGRDLSVAGHAARCLGLLDVLGVQTATVVGHDLGGSIALSMAATAPARVSRLCLVNPLTPAERPGVAPRVVKALRPLLHHVPPAFVLRMLRNRLRRGYVSPERGSHSIDQYLRPLSNGTGRHTLLAQSGALDANFISESALRSVNVPTAIIWGADDPYRPSANAAWLAERIHGATLEVIPGARHFVPEEDYQCVARVVADLLER